MLAEILEFCAFVERQLNLLSSWAVKCSFKGVKLAQESTPRRKKACQENRKNPISIDPQRRRCLHK